MLRRSIFAPLIALALAAGAAAAVPLVAQAGGGCHAANGSVYTEGSATVVKMDVCSFVPTLIRVPVGSAIRFLNTDVQEHMVVGRAGTWASGVLPPGNEFDVTFSAKGTFPYSCPLHPGMVGAVVVGDGVGLSGGAAVGQPETVVPTTLPSSPADPASPAAPASVAPASAGATAPATIPARAETAFDTATVGAAIALAALGGVIVGGLAAGALAGRRRTGTAVTR